MQLHNVVYNLNKSIPKVDLRGHGYRWNKEDRGKIYATQKHCGKPRL